MSTNEKKNKSLLSTSVCVPYKKGHITREEYDYTINMYAEIINNLQQEKGVLEEIINNLSKAGQFQCDTPKLIENLPYMIFFSEGRKTEFFELTIKKDGMLYIVMYRKKYVKDLNRSSFLYMFPCESKSLDVALSQMTSILWQYEKRGLLKTNNNRAEIRLEDLCQANEEDPRLKHHPF